MLMISLIFISSIMLAWEKPLNDPLGIQVRILEIFNMIFSLIFLVEAIMKIIAFGFLLNGKTSYLK